MSDLPRRTVTALVYGAIVLIAALAPREVFLLALAATGALALSELFRLRGSGIAAALELVVLGLGIASLVFLRDLQAGIPWTLLMTIVAVWASDVAAYVIGSLIGRRKIVPRISPGKTWEGTVAGFLAAGIVVVLWNRPFVGLPVWSLVAAVLIGPVAFAGDLLESWVKRRAGAKDSGTLLPGHGGILDRIDSLVAAATLVAATIVLLGRVG